MRQKTWTVVAVAVFSLLTAYIDYLVPQEVPVDILYLVPIGLATFVFGRGGALVVSTSSLLLFIFTDYWFSGHGQIVNPQEFWFATLLKGVLMYGLGWGSYQFKLNQMRLHRARLILEKQVADLNILYSSSQSLVEQTLNDNLNLILQLATRIGEITRAGQVQLELTDIPDFGPLLSRLESAHSQILLAPSDQIGNESEILPLLVNGENFGRLRIWATPNKELINPNPRFLTANPVDNFDPGQPALVEALARHLALALQNYLLQQRNLQLAITDERNRLAREIHDVLAQGFTGIIFQTQAAKLDSSDPQAVQQRLEQIEQLARYNLQEARRSVANLRPLPLEGNSLVEALQQKTRLTLRENGIEAQFRLSGVAPKLPAEVESALYRICQEALSNATRHSGANLIEVSLDFDEDEVCLTISDNGRGFSVGGHKGLNASEPQQFGLATMQERAKLVGGLFSIESTPAAEAENGPGLVANLAETTTAQTIIKSGGSRVRVIVPYDKMKLSL